MLIQMQRLCFEIVGEKPAYTRPYDVAISSWAVMYLYTENQPCIKKKSYKWENLTQGSLYNLKTIYNKHFSHQANIS